MIYISKSTLNKIVLVIQAVFIAVIGSMFPPMFLLFPAIFVFEAMSEGILKSFLMFIITCMFLVTVSIDYAVIIFSLFGPMILIFHLMMSKNFDQHSTVFIAAAMFFVSVIVVLYAFGVNPELLKSKEIINSFLDMQKTMGFNQISETDLMILYNRSLQLMPATFVIMSLILSYITFYVSVKRLIVLRGLDINYKPFMYFNAPRGIIMAGVISIGALYAFGDQIFSGANLVIENLVLVFGSILFFLGLSVVMFMLNKMKAGGFIKFIVPVLGFMIPGAQILFIATGLLDNIFNFRRLAR